MGTQWSAMAHMKISLGLSLAGFIEKVVEGFFKDLT
jgi:hypothetical protein